jgi:hypothetical protein
MFCKDGRKNERSKINEHDENLYVVVVQIKP